jgi:deoxyribonuclease-4
MQILEVYGKSLGGDCLKSLHIHLSGIEYSLKGERNHLPVQESDLDVKSLFRALKKMAASGRILCESPIMEDDAIYMKELWGKE